MSELIGVNYSEIRTTTSDKAAEYLDRLFQSELPAFVVKATGDGLTKALDRTNLTAAMAEHDFYGNTLETVTFSYGRNQILPPNLTPEGLPSGADWYQNGVTPFHQDIGEPLSKISANHTAIGSAYYRLHPGREAYDPVEQWDDLDPQMSNVLLYGAVDPNVLNPSGYAAEVGAGDLLVFDTSHIHSGQSLSVPRSSEAVFFMHRA